MHLIDDGTMDTVIRCEECGEEMRYNWDGEHDEECLRHACVCYRVFTEWAIEDATSEHECGG